jgi:peptidoglycan/xylan/chitin deacetylase (PgdA/CDA1 family)
VNNTFDAIMDASESRGLRSAFYFIADRRAGLIDGNYSLDDPWIRGLLRRIHVRGHEIGLHTSYTTPTDGAQTRYERDRLVRVLDEEGIELDRLGGRQHFLRWRNPITWRNWADAGLDYDSTLGFSEEIGFRAGVCLEYPVFDLEQKRPLALRELPLAAMEVAALDRLQLGPASALEAIIELRETCRRYNGTFTLLWHNSRLVHRTERRLYLEALGS